MKKIISLILVLILAMVWPMTVLADTLQEIEKQKKTIEKTINDIGQEKSKKQKELKNALSDKNAIISKQGQKSKEYQDLINAVKDLNKEIMQIQNDINEAEKEYEAQIKLFKKRLKVMYENSNSFLLEDLLESKSMDDFLERAEIISRILKKDKQSVELLKIAKQDIENKKQLIEEEKQGKEQLADNKKETIDGLKVSRANLDVRIKTINIKLDVLEKQEDEFNRQAEELNDIINNLAKDKGKYAGGVMKWPVPSTTSIASYYGMRVHPVLRKKKMHYGIDIAAARNVTIIAANKGTVIFAEWQSGYGNTVIIDHGGGITTLYAHCSKLLVRAGSQVKAGDVIARVGSTGLSTGPHLHFEVRKNGLTVNPLEYVSG